MTAPSAADMGSHHHHGFIAREPVVAASDAADATTATTTATTTASQHQQQRQFKKHKALPRPQSDRPGRDNSFRRTPKTYNLYLDTAAAAASATPAPAIPAGLGLQPSSPQTLKHQLRRIGTGPDLPPTPPTHSRASSSSHSTIPSSPTAIAEPSMQLAQEAVTQRPPATPPDQRSPPTPDVTPPNPASLANPLRPNMRTLDRAYSGGSAMGPDSRTESFKTAREEQPTSSEDETGRPARWDRSVSASSQATIIHHSTATDARAKHAQESDKPSRRQVNGTEGNHASRRANAELGKFDAKRGPSTPESQRLRDARPERTTSGQQHQQHQQQQYQSRIKQKQTPEPPLINGTRDPVVHDKFAASPTNAIKAVRNMPLQEPAVVHASPNRRTDRRVTAPVRERPDPAPTSNVRRSSSLSTQSGSVVEVLLVDGGLPRRQRTLRHVRRRVDLRESIDTESSSSTYRVDLNESPKPQQQAVAKSPQIESSKSRHESYISTTTKSSSRSISSTRARREIWKSGGIPVVIVPDRKSSRKSSKEPSLRSTSSKRSRTKSAGSGSCNSPTPGTTPVFERPNRRGRAYSESDGSERTVDFPPAIPARSSSLSAPTSRNTSRAPSQAPSRSNSQPPSRAPSFTAKAVEVHTALPQPADPHFSQQVHIISPSTPDISPVSPDVLEPETSHETTEVTAPDRSLELAPTRAPLERQETFDTLDTDRHDDLLSPRKYSSRNTPFSVASMETCGTAPELSEALAVHMYPHQNSSVLMVNHSNKPSDGSEQQKRLSNPPKITMTGADDETPVTPPQQKFINVDVDSPLRNPRAPPQPPKQSPDISNGQPPAINFIPATPSGMTPAVDKVAHQGNFYESLKEKPPGRRPSLVKRAFSRRRHSVDYTPTTTKAPGFLTRRFSLSRKIRGEEGDFGDMEGHSMYPQAEDRPAEEDRLHPFWRPQWINDEDSDFDDDDDDDDLRRDGTYRYPPVDNRPGAPARSLSAKLKKTFAILPNQEYHTDDLYGPQRRTIRRTSSGNLRVMRRRTSTDSLRKRVSRSPVRKPRPIADGEPRKGFWRSRSLSRGDSVKKTRRFSLGSKLEEFQNIPHMLSERRREKRTQRLRQMISGPREVRDGVGEVIRRRNNQTRENGSAASQF